MGTTDRDVLVAELHALLGAQLSREGCEFFLEIGNWNLQAAVGAYYDFYGPLTVPAMGAVDVTLVPGVRVPPSTPLSKTWRLTNTGTEVWQNGTSLTLQSRNVLCGPARVLLPSLRPGQEAEVTVSLLSPSEPGVYQSVWRLTTPTGGVCAGYSVCVVVTVGGAGERGGEDGELADLTQQLAAFSTSDHLNSHYDDSRRNQSVFQADSSFHGSGVGSSPPPPSPVNSSPLATDLLLPLMSHSALLSHPPPSPHNLCDMEPPSSPSPHHHQHTPQ